MKPAVGVKPLPEIVISVPGVPEVGFRDEMVGGEAAFTAQQRQNQRAKASNRTSWGIALGRR